MSRLLAFLPFFFITNLFYLPVLRDGNAGRGRPLLASSPDILLPITDTRSSQHRLGKGFACEEPGWFPTEFGLKDHTIFWYDGYYYLISTYLPTEDRFAYARSEDLCLWEELPPILTERLPEAFDSKAIWAPYVYKEGEVYYLYYTGVTFTYTQRILLATSTDPANPDSWERQETIFNPDHPEMDWRKRKWADCRDPSLIKVEDVYYLLYTGKDVNGGIIGMATSPAPDGPWMDHGSIVRPVDGMLESSTIVKYGDIYYLFYHFTGDGVYYNTAKDPAGPWGEPVRFGPGWAHEVWQSTEGWYTSYLTDYSVTISSLTWDDFFHPTRPFIGSDVHHLMFPIIKN